MAARYGPLLWMPQRLSINFPNPILEKPGGILHEGMSLLAAAHLSEEELRMLVAARRYAALRAGSSDASVVPICGDELSGGSCDL